jgi:peptide/nickel transport system substrate-binding protein
MKRRTLNAVIVLGCLLTFMFLVGACGGDDDESSSSSTSTQTTDTSTTQTTTAAAVPTTAAAVMTDSGSTAPVADAMPEAPSPVSAEQYAMEPESGVPQYGGYLQLSVTEDPRSLNFLDNVSAGTGSTLQGVYDRLVIWKWEGGSPVWKEIAPGIAESWTVSDDGLTWNFKLRNDVMFHDGTPLTSADVKATYDHFITFGDYRPPARSYVGPFVESVDAPDDYTVVLHLNAPAAVLLQNLSAGWVNIASKKDIDTNGLDWFQTNANGTGPYTWAADKWERGVSFELERNDNFWQDGLPYMDGKRYTVIPSSSLLRAAFETQAIDVVSGSAIGSIDQVVANLGDKVRVVTGPGGSPTWTMLNVRHAPFDNPLVRQAVYLALDRQQIKERALQGAPGYLGTWFETNTFAGGYGTTIEVLEKEDLAYKQDKTEARQRAQELLQEAGVDPSKFKLVVMSRGNSPTASTFLGGQVLTSQLQEMGFDVEFLPLESLAGVELLNSGEEWNATVYGSALPYPAPESMLTRYLSSTGQRNYSGLVDDTIDNYAKQITGATNEADRRRNINELETYLREGKNAMFFTYFSSVQFLEQSYVHGRRFVSSWFVQYDERTWLDDASPTR